MSTTNQFRTANQNVEAVKSVITSNGGTFVSVTETQPIYKVVTRKKIVNGVPVTRTITEQKTTSKGQPVIDMQGKAVMIQRAIPVMETVDELQNEKELNYSTIVWNNGPSATQLKQLLKANKVG